MALERSNLNVIVVSDYADMRGGAPKIAIATATGLARRGFHVEFFFGTGPVAPELSGIPSERANETTYNRDPKPLRGALRQIWDVPARKRFGALLARFDPENTIIHLHTFREALSPSVADLAMRRGFKTIYTAHEHSLACPYFTFFNFRENHICTLRGLSLACLATHCNKSGWSKKLLHYVAQFAYAKVAKIPKRLDRVIFVSRASSDVMIPYLGSPRQAAFIANPSGITQVSKPKPEPGCPFVVVGALTQHKDPLTPARAARELGAKIVFIGSGELEDEVRAANPDAEITGWLEAGEVVRRIRSARALIFSSICLETQGLTILEGASSGVPVIASDIPTAVDQIATLESGALYRKGDVADLANKMKPFLDDQFAWEQGLIAQRNAGKLTVTEATYADRLVGLYLEVLGKVPAATAQPAES